MQALTFRIGMDRYAIPVNRVREVIPRIHYQPSMGESANHSGVFVYRGSVVPVLDLHQLAGLGDCPNHLSSRIILVEFEPNQEQPQMGLLAAGVDEIQDVPGPQHAMPFQDVSLGTIVAQGEQVFRWLDLERLERQLQLGQRSG